MFGHIYYYIDNYINHVACSMLPEIKIACAIAIIVVTVIYFALSVSTREDQECQDEGGEDPDYIDTFW